MTQKKKNRTPSAKLLKLLYDWAAESFNIPYHSSVCKLHCRLQRLINTSEKIISLPSPKLEDFFQICFKKAETLLLSLLPYGGGATGLFTAHTSELESSFYFYFFYFPAQSPNWTLIITSFITFIIAHSGLIHTPHGVHVGAAVL